MSAGERFAAQFITGAEVCRILNIAPSQLSVGVKQGILPGEFRIGNLLAWDRQEVQPYLERWQNYLQTGRQWRKGISNE